MENRPIIPTKPFASRSRLMAALLGLLGAGFSTTSAAYKQTMKVGFASGKHNGRTMGAFGGPRRAKPHRALFVAALQPKKSAT